MISTSGDQLGTVEESGLLDVQFSGNTSLEISSGKDSPHADAENIREGDSAEDGEGDDEGEFTYEDSSIDRRQPSDEEDFRYPVSPLVETQLQLAPQQPLETLPPPVQPSSAQLEAIFAAASAGDLPLLQKLFETALSQGDTQAFSLANDATSRTGLTALHAAASRGHAATVRWRK
ncbi:hypothetical protein JB92DRAFT_2796883 [Gautieria morchelliformis]|nr:hypothetical protein JB92DRAFT_2796883 [Gautieria morchelliformis]